MVRPYISTNLAISADGKISSSPPRPSGWTSAADHARFLKLRADVDAILVGRGTLDADRMTMVVPGNKRQPLRCIVSRTGKLDPQHPIFEKPGGAIHLLVTDDAEAITDPRVILHHGAIGSFLEILAEKFDVKRLHCEGGGQLIWALAADDLIDEFHLTLAGHTIFGGAESSTTTGVLTNFFQRTLDFQLTHFEPQLESGECFLTYTRAR